MQAPSKRVFSDGWTHPGWPVLPILIEAVALYDKESFDKLTQAIREEALLGDEIPDDPDDRPSADLTPWLGMTALMFVIGLRDINVVNDICDEFRGAVSTEKGLFPSTEASREGTP